MAMTRFGNYYVGVDCNGDLVEWGDEERELMALDTKTDRWLASMENCDPFYDEDPEPMFAFA